MGAFTSRQNAGVEEADVVSNHAYKYPPRSGNYFGSHFIMGGERFDTPQPEAYLFGENADLNFLGSRPTPFPYPPPQSNEPTKTLKSLVNIRKESLRFVRCPEPVGTITEDKVGDGEVKSNDNGKGTYYNIEFTFDCDAPIAITIFYFCTEEVTPTGVVYYPRDAAMTSQIYHYKKGANQQFCQISHVFDPSKHPEEDLLYNADREIIPIAIYCVVDEGQEGEVRQSHTTIAVVEKHSDGTYVLKALKQKLFVDGLCYLLQEIYGIENKNLDTKPSSDEETEDGGSECVICMCDVRDTLILPCRHLCLCNSCADSLRYQANNCPICRAPFRALLQIRALQKVTSAPGLLPTNPPEGSMENIPAGYEPVSLIEALNGPSGRVNPPPPALHGPAPAPRARAAPPPRAPATIASPDADTASPSASASASQAAEMLNRSNLERSSSTSICSSGSRRGRSKEDRPVSRHDITAEYRMSVLLAREEEANKREEKTATSPLLTARPTTNNTDIHVSKSSLNSEYNNHETGSIHELEECASDDDGSLEGDSKLPVGEAERDGDSDAERLSPLLTPTAPNGLVKGPRASADALRLSAPALAHIDDTDTDEPTLTHNHHSQRTDGGSAYVGVYAHAAGGWGCGGGEGGTSDSDYFTPEDTHTTILCVPTKPQGYSETVNDAGVSTECTPQRWARPHHVTSLPGTPLSQASVRSSGDSYSSSSSTRQLLTAVPAPPRPAHPTHPAHTAPLPSDTAC